MVTFRWEKVSKPLLSWSILAIAMCFVTVTYADTTASPPNLAMESNDKANLAQDPVTRIYIEELRTDIGNCIIP